MLDEPMVTVAEAAKLLHVHTATIRRYINSGRLPAYRIGRRRLAVRRRDLDRLIEPRAVGQRVPTERAEVDDDWTSLPRRLTPEEQRRGLEALERVKALQAEMLAKRGGVPFPESWELINEMRDERPQDLGGTGDGGWYPLPKRFTADEQRRGLAVMDEAEALQAELLARRGGVLLPESWELIAEMREERMRELMGDDAPEPSA